MSDTGLYGQSLAKRVRLNDGAALVARSARRTEVAATQSACSRPGHGMAEPMPCDDALLAVAKVGDMVEDLGQDGGSLPSEPLPPLVFHDLRELPSANFKSPFHTLNFYVPRAPLQGTAAAEHAKRVGDPNFKPGVGVSDPGVHGLRFLLLPTFGHPEQVSRLFVDGAMVAVVGHVAKTGGGTAATPAVRRGGLAPWQERKAKEIMCANLEGDVPISRLAAECNLSCSHFIRCFRQTTGVAPHQWLLQRRVQTAKDMLPKPGLSLSEIALACGFADQSHFTRVFKRIVGVSPGTWRRRNQVEGMPSNPRVATPRRQGAQLEMR